MDRKGIRGGKPKNVPPRDLFALGAKPSAGRITPGTSSSVLDSQSAAGDISHGGDRSREPGGSSNMLKKFGQRSSFTGLSSASRQVRQRSPGGEITEEWEQIAEETEIENLIPFVKVAEERNDSERSDAVICGAIKTLRSQRMKPDINLALTLLYLSKTKPMLFSTSHLIIEALGSLLKKPDTAGYSKKPSPVLPVIAANILQAVLNDVKDWPEILVRSFIDDSVGERIWVDHEESKGLVDNIVASFGTIVGPKNMLYNEIAINARTDSPSSPVTHASAGCSVDTEMDDAKDFDDLHIINRYRHMTNEVEEMVMETVNLQINTRIQTAESGNRSFIRFLSSVCGIQEVRNLIVPKLDIWFQKHHRIAAELLLSLCMNCNTHSVADQKIISNVLYVRLKQHKIYMICLRELLAAHKENIASVIKETLYNELSAKRNTINMQILSVVFQFQPGPSAMILAAIFMEMLQSTEDYLRTLRALLREIVRVLRFDFQFHTFCKGLLREVKLIRDISDVKARMFHSICDIVSLSYFLSISPQVKEAFTPARIDSNIDALRKHQDLVMNIQHDALHWFLTIVPKMFNPTREEYVGNLHKILVMVSMEAYYITDGWPSESDRNLFLRLAQEVPIKEETLYKVLAFSSIKEQYLKPQEIVELLEKLVTRVTSFCQDYSMLHVQDIKIIDMIFNLCVYVAPENSPLPPGYRPPKTAISNVYWKAWTVLLLITANNPTVFGVWAWETYPSLRVMMEMSITNSFIFPPPTMSIGDRGEEMSRQELMLSAKERQQILEFESHLAQKTITEQNSLLISQLIAMDPKGPPRKPPPAVMEQLELLNEKSKVGHLLCKSRDPDFLLDIIQRQGAPHCMPWLAELVHNSEDSFSSLPVQCLCEYLLSETVLNTDAALSSIHQRLVQHLKNLLSHAEDSGIEIMEYFLRRLGSEQPVARSQAIGALALLVGPASGAMEVDSERQERFGWLLRHVPLLPSFPQIRDAACQSLRTACQIETQPEAVSAYIRFLATHTAKDSSEQMAILVPDMAQLIVERTTIVSAILPATDLYQSQDSHARVTLDSLYQIFLNYMRRVRILDEPLSWTEHQDHVRVQWASGEQAVMHILVVHAMVILLIFGPSANSSLFKELLEIWFPHNLEMPQAFLVDSVQEALLLPDWLKLRMIRSNVSQLVDAALKDLEPSQLVLFIQSFGIPVESMSKLLCALDLAVETSEESVTAAVLDRSHKTYMSQLVEVQNHRGAVGGSSFATILVEKEESDISSDPPVEITQLVSPLAIPRTPLIELKTSEIQSFILQCFTSSNLLKDHEKQVKDTLRVLKQKLSKEIRDTASEKPYLQELLSSLSTIMKSQHALSFIQGLHKNYQLSTPILRLVLLLKTKPDAHSLYIRYVELIALMKSLYSPKNSMLQSVLEAFTAEKNNLHFSIDKTEVTREFTCDKIIEKLLNAPWQNLESVLKQLVEQSMEEKKLHMMVHVVVDLLSANFKPFPKWKITRAHKVLLLDWLQVLDPELLLVPWQATDLLLFGTSCHNAEDCDVSKQSYLLSSFTHEVSWPTIGSTVSALLTHMETHLDSVAVLDFLGAVLHVPKLWQGRERRTPRHSTSNQLLRLSSQNIMTLTKYMVAEHKQNKNSNVSKRISLLFSCAGENEKVMCRIIHHLLNFDKSSGESAANILYHIYLAYPSVVKYLPKKDQNILVKTQVSRNEDCESAADFAMHTLLTMICSPLPGKDFVRRMQDLNAAARKMATGHPLLLLRHFPLLASSLQGLSSIHLSALYARNYIELFSLILGVLELLQPLIFLPKYYKPFARVIDSYLDLFDNHGRSKDLNVMLNRLCQLLLDWVGTGSSFAFTYVAKHASLFSSLLSKNSDPPLRSLAAIASSRVSDETRDIKSISTQRDESSVDVICQLEECKGPPINAYNLQRIRALLREFESSPSNEQCYNLLCDVGKQADYSLDYALTFFSKPLLEGIINPLREARLQSWKLLVRLLRVRPKLCSQVYGSILGALDAEEASIANCALEHLPEVILYMPEWAPELLTAAYKVCLTSESSLIDTLTETLFLLTINIGA